MFVDLGFITPDDREEALTVQRESGGLLGEILITHGKITRLELANALSEHWESATGAGNTTENRGPSLIDVPRGDESSRRVGPSNVTELRRLLAELEAARVAAVQAAEAGLTAIDEALTALTQARATEAEATRIANDELRERLDELIALRTADLATSQAAQSQAAHAPPPRPVASNRPWPSLPSGSTSSPTGSTTLLPRSARSDRSARRTRRNQSAESQASAIAETRRQDLRTQTYGSVAARKRIE